MSVLVYIVVATIAAGALSVLAASIAVLVVPRRWVPRMVSFAIGVMLAAALLDLLPSAVEAGLGVAQAGAVVLAGLLLFFVLEKLSLWRHEHEVLDGARAVKPAGRMILVGDAIHNFVDGLLLAAAFLQDIRIGMAATIAVIAHELPQEIGDFMVLIHSGFSRQRALVLNLICSLAAVAGGVLGYFLLEDARAAVPYVLGLAAASFIYIAIADLMPELHRDGGLAAAPLQFVLIVAGIGLIAAGHGVH